MINVAITVTISLLDIRNLSLQDARSPDVRMLNMGRRLDLSQEPPRPENGCEFRLEDLERGVSGG